MLTAMVELVFETKFFRSREFCQAYTLLAEIREESREEIREEIREESREESGEESARREMKV